MWEHGDFPEIEPSTFDTIIVGTGLQESILSAAAASAGHTVLCVDASPFYGSQWTSLPLRKLAEYAHSAGIFPHETPSEHKHQPNTDPQIQALAPEFRPMYSDFEVTDLGLDSKHRSRDFNLDLAGPRLAFCAGPLIDLVLSSGAYNYLEFKSLENTYVWEASRGLVPVPDSRAAIFQHKELSRGEKTVLMRFFKLVQNYGAGEAGQFSDEELESGFAEYLARQRLPAFIKSIILYAIALAEHDQEDAALEVSKVLKTKDGIQRLVLYFSSIGRFVNASGPFLYPVCGLGEFPQVFCRAAAVKGALYVLRMPVVAILIDKESGGYKGIQIASGQFLYSKKLIVNPSISFPELPSLSPLEKTVEVQIPDFQEGELARNIVDNFNLMSVKAQNDSPDTLSPSVKQSWKLVRAVCVTNQSLKAEFSTVLVIFPPKVIIDAHNLVIRALQLGSNTSVCPQGLFVVYLSTICLDVTQGKEALRLAINSLFTVSNGVSTNNTLDGEDQNELNKSSDVSGEERPTLLWYTLFAQSLQLSENLNNQIQKTCMPDETLDFHGVVASTTRIFSKLFPGDEFFPPSAAKEETVEEDDANEVDLD